MSNNNSVETSMEEIRTDADFFLHVEDCSIPLTFESILECISNLSDALQDEDLLGARKSAHKIQRYLDSLQNLKENLEITINNCESNLLKIGERINWKMI